MRFKKFGKRIRNFTPQLGAIEEFDDESSTSSRHSAAATRPRRDSSVFEASTPDSTKTEDLPGFQRVPRSATPITVHSEVERPEEKTPKSKKSRIPKRDRSKDAIPRPPKSLSPKQRVKQRVTDDVRQYSIGLEKRIQELRLRAIVKADEEANCELFQTTKQSDESRPVSESPVSKPGDDTLQKLRKRESYLMKKHIEKQKEDRGQTLNEVPRNLRKALNLPKSGSSQDRRTAVLTNFNHHSSLVLEDMPDEHSDLKSSDEERTPDLGDQPSTSSSSSNESESRPAIRTSIRQRRVVQRIFGSPRQTREIGCQVSTKSTKCDVKGEGKRRPLKIPRIADHGSNTLSRSLRQKLSSLRERRRKSLIPVPETSTRDPPCRTLEDASRKLAEMRRGKSGITSIDEPGIWIKPRTHITGRPIRYTIGDATVILPGERPEIERSLVPIQL